MTTVPALEEGSAAASASWLGPTWEASWAFACGLVASGRLAWLPSKGLSVLTAWLAVDLLLGHELRHWRVLKVASVARTSPSSQRLRVPYAQAGTPGAALAIWLNAPLAGWREKDDRLWQASKSAMALLASFGVSLVLATYVGPKPLALAASGSLIIAALAVISSSRVALFRRWSRTIQFIVAWMMGQLVLGAWRTHSLAMATLFGLALLVESTLGDEQHRFAQGLGRVIWLLLAATMLTSRQPVAAAGIAVCGLANDMSAAVSRKGSLERSSSSMQRRAVMAAAMVSAIAATYWI